MVTYQQCLNAAAAQGLQPHVCDNPARFCPDCALDQATAAAPWVRRSCVYTPEYQAIRLATGVHYWCTDVVYPHNPRVIWKRQTHELPKE